MGDLIAEPGRQHTGGRFQWICLVFAAIAAAAVSASPALAAKAVMVPLVHPEWDGLWKLAPGTVPDRYESREKKGVVLSIETPPLKPEYLEAYSKRIRQLGAGERVPDPADTECLPYGMPRMMLTSHPFRVSVMPTKLFIYMPWGIQPRHIFLDGREHPSDDDIDLTYRGESVGRWDGDTLVIDTKGFTTKTFVDGTGVPHGEKMHLVERVTMLKGGELEWTISIDDPDYFVRPWVTKKRYVRVLSGDIGDERICSAERSTGHY